VKSELDDMKGKTLEDMSEMVQKFNKKIAEKKNDLAPIIKASNLHNISNLGYTILSSTLIGVSFYCFACLV